MTFGPIYVDLTRRERLSISDFCLQQFVFSVSRNIHREASTGFHPFHVTKVGNFRIEKQQAPGIRVLINRQHFKTGVLEIPIRESLFSHAFHIPPFLPFSFVCNSSFCSSSSTSFIASQQRELLQRISISLRHPCYLPLIRVQSATDDNQLQRRVFSGDPIFHHFVSPSPKLTRDSLPPDPPSPEHDVCGLNYSGGFTRNPGSRFKGSACLAQSLPRRHRLRRSQDLTGGTLLNGRRTRNDLED